MSVPNTLQTRLRVVTDESPDEAASTRYFLARISGCDVMPEIPTRLDWIGATDFMPLDEYTGGDAA
jgi:hypothetical protein